MAKFIFGYHGRAITDASAELDPSTMAAWGTWFRGIGPALVDVGQPAAPSRIVDADGKVGPPNGAGPTGYSIVEAPTLEQAMALARGCPVFGGGGSIEVAELVTM